jgi:RNA methyltransferase, TrmH family
VAWARLQRAEIWVAEGAGEPVERLPRKTTNRPPVALVLGNEGAGVSAALDAAADRRIAVPLARQVESLNVAIAAGILLYEVTRES